MHLIPLQRWRDQPITEEFTKYIRKPSSAQVIESVLARLLL